VGENVGQIARLGGLMYRIVMNAGVGQEASFARAPEACVAGNEFPWKKESRARVTGHHCPRTGSGFLTFAPVRGRCRGLNGWAGQQASRPESAPAKKHPRQ
jgi:hypothetical protein